MKLVINTCYGGFDVPDECLKDFGVSCSWHIERNDPKLVSLAERLIAEGKNSFDFSRLVVVDIPDEATDYMINEHDGMESVIYVLDGKLHIL